MGLAVAALFAFLIGAGGVGYAAWSGLLPIGKAAPDKELSAAANAPQTAAALPPASPARPDALSDAAVQTRVAALEQRLDQLDLRAAAASGNAARAEGLLVAFAARRALDRGAQLGYLEDQLKLRFADAQPRAVQSVIDAARQPVTLEWLVSGLDVLSPKLTSVPITNTAWDTLKHELASLFIVRHDSAPSAAPSSRLDRAKLYLTGGKIEEAVAEVEHLPGAAGAKDWIAAARRYDSARRALDLIETTALLENHDLKDDKGQRVEQPSPITPAGNQTP